MSAPVAIILAAGLGSRLGARTAALPKGLLPLSGRGLVAHSVDRLRGAGVARIRIVTGHCAEAYDRHFADAPDVETVFNADYADTGSLLSLVRGGAGLQDHDGPVLILESDLVFEARALILLRDLGAGTLVSTPTGAGDEVHVWADGAAPGRPPRLRALSKDPAHLAQTPLGEFTGLNVMPGSMLRAALDPWRDIVRRDAKADYEDGLVALARTAPFGCCLVDDLAWAEIDDAAMLARVEADVWPEIVTRDACQKR